MESRKDNIDIVKGIGIILMIMGHIGFTELFSIYIHAFNMPLFYFVSGYLYITKKEEKVIHFVTRKAKRLLIPYALFGIFHLVLAIFLKENYDFIFSLKHLFWYNNTGLPITGALWFLTSLFISYIIFDFLSRKIQKNYMAIVCILIAMGGCLCKIALPFSMNSAFVGVGFLYLGNQFRKYEMNKKTDKYCSLNWIIILALMLLNATIIINIPDVNMRKNDYGNIPFFWFNAIFGIVLYWNIAKRMIFWGNSILQKMITVIKYIGIHSITFMCLNELAILLVDNFLNYMPSDNLLTKIIIKVIRFTSVFIFLFVINEITCRIKSTRIKKK